MKKPSRLGGCALAGLLLLVLLVIAGAWWFFRPQVPGGGAPPASPVQVFLLSPSSGDEVAAGDFVSVSLQANAPGGITSAELFVDGESLGVVSDLPESAAWSWRAWPAGVHTLSARATSGDGQVGESQTVLVNVLVLSETINVLAGEGQTLADIGGQFGVPPDEMAGANPHQNPSKPLADGQPVHVPTGGAAPLPPGGGGPGGGNVPFSIVWELKLTKAAEKSYCYLSDGGGVWEKIPKPPFNFFPSMDNLYTQLFEALPQQEVVIQAQCWGWMGGALEFLGDGQTKFDPREAANELVVDGKAFQLIGQAQNSPILRDVPAPAIPPPYALREPKNLSDCESHGGDAAICQVSLNSVSEIVLEWEWQPGNNWPGNPTWINDINGYEIYEIDPSNNSQKYMKEVDPASLKVTALPLGWGSPCYGVQAYAEGVQFGGIIFSDMVTYCPGQPPAMQQVFEEPSDWLTSGGEWINNGDCPLKTPFYSFDGDPVVLVGRYLTYYDGGCYREGSYSGGVKFPVAPLPPGAVLQKALLRFSTVLMDYGAPFVATNLEPEACVSELGRSTQDWSGLGDANHYSHTELSGAAYYSPDESLSGWFLSDTDVTAQVHVWLKYPENNHGFILIPMEAPDPTGGGTGKCLSGLGNFQLEIDFYAP
jgi:hypothetical protein